MNCKVCQNLSAKNPSLSFFRFPSDYNRCRDWAKRCDILPIFDEYGPAKFYKSFRICSEHFDSKYVVFDGRKKKLLSCAVPKEFHRKEPLQGIADQPKNTNPQPRSNSCYIIRPLKNFCRFCAEEDTKLTDIFSWRGRNLKLEEKIKVFPITVRKEDELPLRVCRKCIFQISKVYEIINSCIRADVKLKRILRIYKHKVFGDDGKIRKKLKLADTKNINDGKPILHQESKKMSDTKQHQEKFLLLKEYKNPELPKNKYVCLRASVQQGQGPSQIPDVHESKECEGDKQEKENKKIYSGEGAVSGIQEGQSSEKSIQDKHLTNVYQQEHEHLNVYKYTCRKCFKRFCSSEILESHEKAHSLEPDEQGRFICQTCGKVFQNRYRLNEHNGFHTGECPYKCSVCNKRFHKRALLRQHLTIHDSEKRFACSMCNLRSNRKGNMIQHLKNHYKKLQNENSGDQTKKQAYLETVETTECKKRRLSTENLNAMSSVPAEQPTNPTVGESNNGDSQSHKFRFICGLCREQYLDLESLGDHFKVHTGENWDSSHGETPIEADKNHSDDRAAESKKSIKRAACKRKGDERKFQCEECGVKFKRKDTLTIHFRIHTGERPYMCKICGFTFKQRGDCLKHERNHSKENDNQIF